MTPARHRRLLAVLTLAAAVLVSLLAGTEAATARGERSAPIGSDRFVVSRYYRGDFPDPSVLRVGSTWYAYGTTISSLNLPVMASSDLVHWRALGEGLKKAPRWSAYRTVSRQRRVAATWAPSVARFGSRYVHAYATRVRWGGSRRMCVSLSYSKWPGRGFVDRSARPFICYPDRGAIDPSFFTAPDGRRYLLWKSEQTATAASHVFITQMSPDGRRRAPWSRWLMSTSQPWERPLVENPSMIHHAGRYYLFYSAGSYANASYATGYAVCATRLGPCSKPTSVPLMATGGTVSGPGGAAAFVDTAGRLRLAYAAWDLGNTGYPSSTTCLFVPAGCAQRRMHVATLGIVPDGTGRLTILSRG